MIRAAFPTASVTNDSQRDLAKRLRSSGGYPPEHELVAVDDDRLVGHALTIVVDGRPGERDRGRVADIAGTVVTGSRSGTLGPTRRSETVLGAFPDRSSVVA